MRRGFFFSVFLRVAIALVFLAIAGFSSVPQRWLIAGLLMLAWAGISAFLFARSVRQDVKLLQDSAAAIPERQIDEIRPSFNDFDGLARAMSDASGQVRRALNDASESRLELEAMIDSMQDAVVAVDPAGRIQWTNQRMQKLIPGASFSSAIRVGHAQLATAGVDGDCVGGGHRFEPYAWPAIACGT